MRKGSQDSQFDSYMACSDSRRFLLLAATTATDDLPVDLWQDQHIWDRMGWRWSEAMVVEIIKGKWKSHSVAIVIEFYSAIFSLYSVSLCYFGIFHPKLFIYLSARSLHSLPVLGRITDLQKNAFPFTFVTVVAISMEGVTCHRLLSFKCRFFVYRIPL